MSERSNLPIELPPGWNAIPLRAVARRRDETDRPDLPLLSVYRDLGVVEREGREDNFNKPGMDLSTYRVVSPGDLVLNKMKTWQGSLGVSDLHGIVSPAYFVCELTDQVDRRFLHYVLRSRPYVAEYAARSKGIRPAQWDLPWDEFKSILVATPPPEIQKRIAAFLDRETTRIDALIERKRTMQGLLMDRRSTVVDAALAATDSTKGWAHSRLKFLVGRATSGNRDHSFTPDEGGVPCLRGINVKLGRIVLQDLERMSVVDHERHGATRLRAGDVVIVRSGNAGVASVVPPELDDSNCVDLVIVRRSPQVDSKLVEVAINSSEARRQIELRRAAAALGHFNAEDVGELMVAVPESLAEQRRLVEELDLKTSVLNVLVEKLDGQVLLLTEHRQALITAAVTGQIEVSGEAA